MQWRIWKQKQIQWWYIRKLCFKVLISSKPLGLFRKIGHLSSDQHVEINASFQSPLFLILMTFELSRCSGRLKKLESCRQYMYAFLPSKDKTRIRRTKRERGSQTLDRCLTNASSMPQSDSSPCALLDTSTRHTYTNSKGGALGEDGTLASRQRREANWLCPTSISPQLHDLTCALREGMCIAPRKVETSVVTAFCFNFNKIIYIMLFRNQVNVQRI